MMTERATPADGPDEAASLKTDDSRIGLPDRFIAHGAPALLHNEVGFTGKHIAEQVEAALVAAERA